MKKFIFHNLDKFNQEIINIKIILVTVFFMVISFVAFSQGKKTVYFDKDWEVSGKDSAYYYREAYFDEYGNELGRIVDYYMSGKIQMTGTCADRGVKNGDFTWYFENGQKKEYGFYYWGDYTLLRAWDINGNSLTKSGTGKLTRYYENQILRSETNYKNGKCYGNFISYHRNGQKFEEGVYENNLLILSSSVDEKGNPMIINGNGEYIAKYNNGKIKCKGIYEEGLREGEWNWWYPNGNIKETANYMNGLKEGEYSFWYSFGKIYSKGTWMNGMREGEWTWYREDGSSFPTVYFEKGKFVR